MNARPFTHSLPAPSPRRQEFPPHRPQTHESGRVAIQRGAAPARVRGRAGSQACAPACVHPRGLRSPSGSGRGEHGAPGCGEAGTEEGEDTASGLSRGCSSTTFAVDVFTCVRCGGRLEGGVREASRRGASDWEPLGLPLASARRASARGHPRPRGGGGASPRHQAPAPAAPRVGGRPGQACPPSFAPGPGHFDPAVGQGRQRQAAKREVGAGVVGREIEVRCGPTAPQLEVAGPQVEVGLSGIRLPLADLGVGQVDSGLQVQQAADVVCRPALQAHLIEVGIATA